MNHRFKRILSFRLFTTVALVCFGFTNAEAHLVTTGLGPVYDGVAHMVLSPADLTGGIVLMLLGAMRGVRSGRLVLALFPAAWLIGGLTGMMFPITTSLDWGIGLSFLLAGALVAADRNLSLLVVVAVVAIIGTLNGFLTGAILAKVSSAGLELTGELVTLIVIITLVGGLVVSLKVFWMRIVVRVLGSWIAATGLLIIGWSLRA